MGSAPEGLRREADQSGSWSCSPCCRSAGSEVGTSVAQRRNRDAEWLEAFRLFDWDGDNAITAREMHGVLETLGMGTLQLSKNIVVKGGTHPLVCVCVREQLVEIVPPLPHNRKR